MHERRYWIGVVSRDHVEIAVADGFVQLNHGKAAPLERMQAGDGFAFYSPRESYPDGAPLQAFTAIGSIARRPDLPGDDRRELGKIFRRDVAFLDATPAPIRPLVPQLTFIRSKTHWGVAFRFGLVRVPREDFATIATAMGRNPRRRFQMTARDRLATARGSNARRLQSRSRNDHVARRPPVVRQVFRAAHARDRVHDRRGHLLVVGRPSGASAVDHRRVGNRVLARAVHDALRRRRAARDARPRDAARRARRRPARACSPASSSQARSSSSSVAHAHDGRQHEHPDERVAVPRGTRRARHPEGAVPRRTWVAMVVAFAGIVVMFAQTARCRPAHGQPAGARRLVLLRRAGHRAAQVPRDRRHAAAGDDRRHPVGASSPACSRRPSAQRHAISASSHSWAACSSAPAACSRRPRRRTCRRPSSACSRCSSRSSGRSGCGC